MPILRTRKSSNYTVLANEIVNRKDMSLKAKGLLWYLLSRPDDWEFTVGSLTKYAGSDGKDSVGSGIDELKRLGYIDIDESPRVHGKYTGGIWTVRETPVEDDQSGKTAAENPQRENRSGKPAPVYNIVTKEGQPSTEELTPKAPESGAGSSSAVRSAATSFITHLNELTGKRYRVCDSVIRDVRARLADGYSEADLLAVADNMAAKWLGDPKMAQYVQPSTLLRASKFDGYLNSTSNGTPKGGVDWSAYDF